MFLRENDFCPKKLNYAAIYSYFQIIWHRVLVLKFDFLKIEFPI